MDLDRKARNKDGGRFLANGDGDGERRTATATIEVGSPTDFPFFVVFLQICKIAIPIGFGFFLLFIEIFVPLVGVQNAFKTLFQGCGNLHFVDCQFKMEIFFGSVSVAVHMFASNGYFF